MKRRLSRATWSALALLAALLCAGCGVKNTETPTYVPPSGSGATTPILLTLSGDASADALVSFYANISQVQITPRQGNASTLYTSTGNVEITHLGGNTQYLAMSSLSPGSYINIIVSLNSPVVTYINSTTGKTVTEQFPAYTGTAQVNFAELLTVGATPLEITLDFNLEKSVVLDPTTGALTLAPVFTASAAPISASSPAVGAGLLQDVLGTVTHDSNGVLDVSTSLGQFTLGCNITASTAFVNGSATLPPGALVRADMAAQPGSSFDCVQVDAINSSNTAFAVSGIVNSYRGGTSPYQMTVAIQDATGAGVSPNFIGAGINVNFDSPPATFAIDWDGVDQTNIGFTPVFSASTFFPAQFVEASSNIPLVTAGNDVGAVPGSLITAAAMSAQQITLRKQQESGTPSLVTTDANGVTRFTLALDPGSVFAQYTALPVEPLLFVPTINVVVPASVAISGSLTVPIAGAPLLSLPYVQVYGLLFLNGGSYTLVAQSVTATLPPVVTTTTTPTS